MLLKVQLYDIYFINFSQRSTWEYLDIHVTYMEFHSDFSQLIVDEE